jgi:hypothetical protein
MEGGRIVMSTRSRCSRFALLLALVAALPAAADAATLTRYPWVNLLTTNSVLIAWQTDVVTDSSIVQYSEDTVNWVDESIAASATDHAVPITGLTPDLTYFYRIVSGGQLLSSGDDFFITAPDTELPFAFVAFGDIGAATAEQIAVAAQVEDLVSSFAILTGDIIYESGEAANFTPQFFDIYAPTLARIPFYTALGNHDELTSGGQPYLDTFHLPSNNAAMTERYYSFDYGNAHFVCLEVVAENTIPNAAMLTWLDQDLASSPKLWKFVYFHVPAYSNSGTHGGDAIIAAALEPIFLTRGVDVVFQGHNHFYTRTYPLNGGIPVNVADDPNYFNPAGPVWITTGGGGRSLYAVDTPLSSIEAFSESRHHVVYVTVIDNQVSIGAIDKDGSVFDAAFITKSTTTAVTVSGFEARGRSDGIALRWTRTDGGMEGGFHVDRAGSDAGPWTRITPTLLYGRAEYEFVDRDAEPGVVYAYRLAMLDRNGRETVSGAVSASWSGPLGFALGRARPNPARGLTSLPFALDRAAPTRVVIVDVAGRLVRTLVSRPLPAGAHTATWNGRDERGREAPAGVYFAVVRAGDREATTRIALLR